MLSFDARGHGETVVEAKTEEKSTLDMALTTLSQDLTSVIRLTQEAMKWPQLPKIVLVGHSLGGAVVTEVAKSGELGDKVLGYAVLDVVEGEFTVRSTLAVLEPTITGSAMDALQSMQTYLATRPSGFQSVAEGIAWQ